MDKVTVAIRAPTPVGATIKERQSVKASISNVRNIGGTSDYNKLSNLPRINGVELKGDLITDDLGIVMDYGQAINQPSVNQHTLRSGENSLFELGIGRASNADINRLF